MTEDLVRLIYHSSNLIHGSADEMDRALRDILAASRRNNARLDVTGALMFNESCFTQVLEGPRGAIKTLFQNIAKDKRHTNVALLTCESIAERNFDRWSMAFVGTRDAEGRLAALAVESGFDPSGMSGEETCDFLRGLMLKQEQMAA